MRPEPISINRTTSLDSGFITPFLISTRAVITTMASIDVVFRKPTKAKQSTPLGDVAGLITLETPTHTGQFVISFPGKTITHIASSMLGEPLTEIDDTVTDCVGEITNMAMGGAKAKLQKIHDINMAIPEVKLKKDYKDFTYNAPTQIVAPFATSESVFWIELGFIAR